MKFHDLAIGQRFELEGVAYVKTGPLLAGQVEGGGSKFMPRYVMVRLLDGPAPQAHPGKEKMLAAGEVLAAFEAYHLACCDRLEKLAVTLPPDLQQEFTSALKHERQAFLDRLLKE